MSRTMEQIIGDCVLSLQQVSGLGIQTYTEPQLMNLIQQNFDALFDRMWWKDYMEWYTRTLDGFSGHVTATLPDVKRYVDIFAVLTITVLR